MMFSHVHMSSEVFLHTLHREERNHHENQIQQPHFHADERRGKRIKAKVAQLWQVILSL